MISKSFSFCRCLFAPLTLPSPSPELLSRTSFEHLQNPRQTLPPFLLPPKELQQPMRNPLSPCSTVSFLETHFITKHKHLVCTRLVGSWVGWLVGCWVGWSVGRSVDWIVGWVVGWVGRSVTVLAGCLVGRLVEPNLPSRDLTPPPSPPFVSPNFQQPETGADLFFVFFLCAVAFFFGEREGWWKSGRTPPLQFLADLTFPCVLLFLSKHNQRNLGGIYFEEDPGRDAPDFLQAHFDELVGQ